MISSVTHPDPFILQVFSNLPCLHLFLKVSKSDFLNPQKWQVATGTSSTRCGGITHIASLATWWFNSPKNPREKCHDLKKNVEIEIKMERLKHSHTIQRNYINLQKSNFKILLRFGSLKVVWIPPTKFHLDDEYLHLRKKGKMDPRLMTTILLQVLKALTFFSGFHVICLNVLRFS